jgi:TRAP-type C4-dicarboxylate transport system permease small subunit
VRELGRVIEMIPEVVVGLIVIAIAVLINVEIAMRYVLNQPVGWSDELSRVLMVWLTFLGAAVAVGRGSHLGLNVLGRHVSGRRLRVLNSIASAIVFCFAIALLLQGITATGTAFRQVLTMTGLSVGWQYMAAPVGAALMMIYAVRNVLQGRDPVPDEAHTPEGAE